MKTIRNLVTMVGLSVVLFALSVAGAKAQQSKVLSVTEFGGAFTLPQEAVWGEMTLPAGEYHLFYGSMQGSYFVEVQGTAKGSPHGVILAHQPDPTSARKNSIICVREGNTLVVRGLEMPAIGEAASFALPRGQQLTAKLRDGSTRNLLASAPMLIERVPVTLNAK